MPPSTRRKVALVGFASSSRDHAPFQDESWDIWGCNTLWAAIPRYDAWIELHPPVIFRSGQFHPAHEAWLQRQECPIYMQQHYPDIPHSLPFPREEVIKTVGLEYFTSSIAWMLGLALLLDYTEIGLYGIDMLGESEYAYQRSCVEYLIGIAHGRGKHVHLPDVCPLLKGQHVYGFEPTFTLENFAIKKVVNRRQTLYGQRDEALQNLYRYDGALSELKYWRMAPDAGSDPPEWNPETVAARQQKLIHDHEQLERLCYTLDGQCQELHYWETQARHLARGGA